MAFVGGTLTEIKTLFLLELKVLSVVSPKVRITSTPKYP